MIEPKKLSTIREELTRALKATGEDPIRWLEQRMATPRRQGGGAAGESEVLHSLRRFLKGTDKKKPRKRRVSTKK